MLEWAMRMWVEDLIKDRYENFFTSCQFNEASTFVSSYAYLVINKFKRITIYFMHYGPYYKLQLQTNERGK